MSERAASAPEGRAATVPSLDGASARPTAAGSPGARLQKLRRAILSIESVIGLAIALTLLAVAYRDRLTGETLSFDPSQQSHAFYSYTYDDRGEHGTSVATADPARPLAVSCHIGPGFPWPYCALGLTFDVTTTGRGLDLSKFDSIKLTFRYQGTAKFVRIDLRNRDPRYAKLARVVDQPNEIDFPVHPGRQSVSVSLDDFAVAGWWKDQTKAPPALAAPSFRNVMSLELITGLDSGPGDQRFEIERITMERRWISPGAWYAGIALCWMILIASLLLARRAQFARMRRESERALRNSERLYRSILETSTDTIVLLSPEGYVELVNSPGVAAMEFDSPDRVVGKHWTRLWRQDSAPMVASALAQAARGETGRFRAFCSTSKRTPKWWDVVVSPMHNDDGSLKALLTISRDITVEREKSDQLKWASEHDALTQLPNRRAFQARLQAATLRAMENGGQVGLLLVDLDHFKHVNDTLGHGAGDELLKGIGERLRKAVRDGDFVARIGGDEFAIVLEDVESEDILSSVGSAVLTRVRNPVVVGDRAVTAGASIGGALFPEHAESADELFKKADTALYALKDDGRGGTRLFDPYMLVEAQRTASQLNLARGAVSQSSVTPLYQPKIELDTGRVAGVEALLRWTDGRRGLQLPASVQEAFKDYELASKIGEVMHEKVADEVRRWLEAGVDFGRVSINAAPAEFLRDDYAERLLSVLEKKQVPADLIEVEVTEHAFLGRGPEYVARALEALKAAGTTIALDDFGTGSSSLSHLRDFPVDVVKIDMSFVQQMTDNNEIASIVTAVVRLAQSLGMDTVGEGVETPAQRDLLRAMGCKIAQGHLFSPAISAEEVAELFPSRRVAA